jgi:predicted membrane protein
MFEKNLSCDLRVIFAVLSVFFLLAALFSKFFAILGFIITAFVAATGVCMGAKILGPALCKKSVTDALSNAKDEVKVARR